MEIGIRFVEEANVRRMPGLAGKRFEHGVSPEWRVGEACVKCGWEVHAWCLMRNHFHLAVETPLANLIVTAWIYCRSEHHGSRGAVGRRQMPSLSAKAFSSAAPERLGLFMRYAVFTVS
jgi:hypothetical protein